LVATLKQYWFIHHTTSTAFKSFLHSL